MIELLDDRLKCSLPEVHEHAKLSIEFQRTLRIPDDDSTHYLPPGLGNFPLRHVDDFTARVDAEWIERGGVMLPMHQAEAMWILFRSPGQEIFSGSATKVHMPYPFAIRVAAGKIDAVTGETWSEGIHRNPQNYMVSPGQPWLDGYCVEKGVIRQFVAMPLGSGYSAEEQITGKAEHGGLQIAVYPMKADAYERRAKDWSSSRGRRGGWLMGSTLPPGSAMGGAITSMGLAPGGRMRQEIFEDPYDLDEWDLDHSSRCFVHIANSEMWKAITGERPPTKPPTATQYSMAGLPWFDYYDEELSAVPGGPGLAKVKSVATLEAEKGEQVLPENEPVLPERVIKLRRGLKKNEVREGRF